jgi:uncharacterized peroxidase-related enzyme
VARARKTPARVKRTDPSSPREKKQAKASRDGASRPAAAKNVSKAVSKIVHKPVLFEPGPPSAALDDIAFVALSLPETTLSDDMQAYFDKCMEKLGFIPNVLKAYAFDMAKLEAFVAMYNDLMLGASGLSKLEREMIAVAVSSQNRCYYCLVAHGAAVRQISVDPPLGELMVMNYRAARLSKRQRAMLDFAVKLTNEPWTVEDADREALRHAGFSDRDIWDIAAITGFFNMSNRVATATDMRPNSVYHVMAR